MKRDPNIPLYSDPVFRTACDLEDPLVDIRSYAHAILMMEDVGTDDDTSALHSLAKLIKDRAETVEKARGEIFHLTHPRREELERKRQHQQRDESATEAA